MPVEEKEFQSSYRAVVEHFQSDSRAARSFGDAEVQFQSNKKGVSEQFQSSFRAGSFGAAEVQF